MGVLDGALWGRCCGAGVDALWSVVGAQVRCVMGALLGRRGWRFVMWVHLGKYLFIEKVQLKKYIFNR